MSKNLFSKIAISLSGGGYRATAFHLGTLSFLNQLTFTPENGQTTSLLDRVKVLSTISGGTFTGVMWAYYNSQGKPFEDCFLKLYGLLEKDNLIDAAFDKLNGKSIWKNHNKSKNLINAFAEVYNDDFFDQASFDTFLKPDNQLTIETVVFNATEFKYGLAFRFQNGTGLFGNHNVHLDKNIVGEIKLGDIVASSSCFPGGFEPLIFPNDYIQSKDSKLAKGWKKDHSEPMALMDGGIIDNQGIDGVKLAENRLEESIKRGINPTAKIVDTFIASDVEGKKMHSLEIPKKATSNSTFSINKLKRLLIFGLIASIGLLIGALWMVVAKASFWWVIGIIIASITTVASGTVLYFIDKIKNFVGKTGQSVVNQSGTDLMLDIGILFNTPISVLKNLLALRAASTLTMVNGVFLKRIRRLQYKSLYNDTSPWKEKMVGNFLYSLPDEKKKAESLEKKQRLSEENKKFLAHYRKVSDKALKIVQQGNSMPTTLWFSDDEKKGNMLDSLVITGQITVCRKLINFIDKKRDQADFEEAYKDSLPLINQIYTELDASWKQFNENPQWLLKKIKNE